MHLILNKFSLCADGAVQKIEFTEEPKNLVALENENAIFRCSAVTVPPQQINYMWKKNDVYMDIRKIPRAEITSSGSLVISSVKRSDFGSYRCIAQCTDGAIISQRAKLEKPGNTVTFPSICVLLISKKSPTNRPYVALRTDFQPKLVIK